MAPFLARKEFKNKLQEFACSPVVIKASNFTIYSFLHAVHLYMEFQNSSVIGTEFWKSDMVGENGVKSNTGQL